MTPARPRWRLSAFVVCIVAMTSCGPLAHPVLRIENKSSQRVSAVKITARGFERTIPSLDPGASRMIVLKPKGESNVGVSFLDARGKRHVAPPNGYIEDSALYTAKIDIGPDMRVTVSTRVLP